MPFINRRRSLFIRGAPDQIGTMPLFTGPAGDEGDSTDNPKIPLTMVGQPGGVIPLFITPNGPEVISTADLYINGGIGVGGGGADWQGYGDLVISGTAGINDTQTTTLYIGSTDLALNNEDAPLYIVATPPLSTTEDTTLFITATQIPTSGDGTISDIGSLYIRSNAYNCGADEDALENAAFEPLGTLPGSHGNGAYVAYSLRQVVSDYNGPAIRASRASDSEEKDFSFSDLELGNIGDELVLDPSFDTGTPWTSDSSSFTVSGGVAFNDGVNDGGVTATLAQDFIYNKERSDYYILNIVIDSFSSSSQCGLQIGKTSNRSFSTYFSIINPGTYAIVLKGSLIDYDVGRMRIYCLDTHTVQVSYLSIRPYAANELEQWLFEQGTEPMSSSSENGFICKWYDQSGSGRDVYQETFAAQPRIALRGAMQTTVNGGTANDGAVRPTISFRTGDYLFRTEAIGISNYPFFITTMASREVGSSGFAGGMSNSTVAQEYYLQGPRENSGLDRAVYSARNTTINSLPIVENIDPATYYVTSGHSLSATSHKMKANQLGIGTTTDNVVFETDLDTITVGRGRVIGSALDLKGYIQEFIIYGDQDIESDLYEMHENLNVYYRTFEFETIDNVYGWDTNETSFGAGAAFTNSSAGSAPTLTTQTALSPGFYTVSFDVDSLNNGGGDGTLEIKISGETVYTITGSGDLGNQAFQIQTNGGLFQIASATSSDEWEVSNLSVSTDNCRMTLHIETDFDTGNTAPLYIADVGESEDITLTLEGNGSTADSTTLVMKSTDAQNITLYTKGFLE